MTAVGGWQKRAIANLKPRKTSPKLEHAQRHAHLERTIGTRLAQIAAQHQQAFREKRSSADIQGASTEC